MMNLQSDTLGTFVSIVVMKKSMLVHSYYLSIICLSLNINFGRARFYYRLQIIKLTKGIRYYLGIRHEDL